MKSFAIALPAGAALACLAAYAQPATRDIAPPPQQALTQAATALRESIAGMEQQQEAGARTAAALRHAKAALVRTQDAIVSLDAQVKEVDEAAKAVQARASASPKAAEAAKLAAGPSKAPETKATAAVEGCWVRLHEQPNYAGAALTLAGAVDVREVTRQAAPGWRGVGSVVVGPRARLIAAKNGATLTIAPGQQLDDVTQTVPAGLFASLDQVKVSCAG
jgi:hypothetical protein